MIPSNNINNGLNGIQEKYLNEINIPAFMDDITAQLKGIKTSQEIFTQINKEIKELKMEISTSKCELTTNVIKDKIIKLFTNEQISNPSNAKYLG